MSKWAALAGSNGAMVASAAAVAVAAVGAGFYINSRQAPEPVAVVQPVEPAPVAVAAPDPQDVADIPETPPSIDEVRVEADGLTIVAGRASPGSKVSVLLDGVENTSVTADAGGGFAAITTIVPKPTAQVLTIVQRLGDRSLSSVEEIILAPTAVAEATPAPEVVPEADPVVAAETTPEPAPEDVVVVEPTPAPEAETAPVEPVVAQTAPAAETATPTADPAPSAPVVVAEVVPTPTETAPTEAAPTETAPSEAAPTVPADVVAATVPEQTAPEPTREPAPTVADVAVVPTPAPAAPEAAEVEEVEPVEPSSTEVAVAETPVAPTPSPEVAEAPAEPQTITVLKSTADGVEVLGAAPEALDSIAIDTISYSNAGDVQLAGRAQSQADAVRVYVDNRVITELPVDQQGRWRGDLPDIDTGVYTLRVDEMNEAGDVTSRVETPFRREDPAVLAAADTPQAAATQVTVQTGATLWAIARDRYGEGRLFVQVFEANRDSIRDPDLIYPGQVFDLPN